jgi:hypothetical protein
MDVLPPRHPSKYRSSLSPTVRRTSITTRASLDSTLREERVSSKSPRARKTHPATDDISNTDGSFSTFEEKKEEEVGRGSKFHDALEDRDWEKLEALLKKYDKKYWRRVRQRSERSLSDSPPKQDEDQDSSSATTPSSSPGSLAKSRAVSMLKYFPQSMSQRRAEREKKLVSPLLTKDHEGRTPLHLALQYRCPEKLLLELISMERTAANVPDKLGRVPLHIAVQLRMHDHILEKIIKANPNGLKIKDLQGRSPVGLTVEMARELQEVESPENSEQLFCWGSPTSTEEEGWQFKQEKIWSKVDYLLKDLMKRNKCVIPSEHGLILEALEGGSPPKIINRFISTADKYLMLDDNFAGSALALCTKRRYCLHTLEYLLENCQERTTMITDYTHKALVSYYRFGCHAQKEGAKPYGKELIDMAKTRSQVEPRNEEDSGDETKLGSVSDACREWWESMQHLLFYCAYGKDFKANKKIKEKHLLHAAVATAATPPSLIQLILVLHPDSRSELCPVFNVLPIHIMCTRWKHDILHKEKDVTMERVIKHFLKPERQLMVRRHRGRLPIHLACDVAQAWSFLKPFVSMDKKAIGMRDPHTKLFPFQMAAVKFPSKNIAMFLRNQYTPCEWRVISTHEKREEYTIAETAASNRQIGTIFELLRRHPDAITGKVISRDVKFSKDLEGVGPVSRHYLSWVYGRGSRGWKLQPANVKLLRDSILNANISKALMPWWDRLKHFIWMSSKNDSLPHTEDYLLHAALYNPDTPPLVVELLLDLYPMSAAKVIPGTDIYPLHIAAATTPYHSQPFEIPNRMDSLRLTFSAYKSAVSLTLHGRLPLHICIARGKTWPEMRPLVQQHRQSLMVVDPQTGLAPFQLMSVFNITSKEHSLRFSNIAARRAIDADMDSMNVKEKARFLRGIKEKQDLDVLTSIYQLLRNGPNAIYAISQRITGDFSSIGSSELLENMEEEDADQTTLLGVAATLEQFLQDIQKSPSRHENIRDYVMSPEKKRKNSLGSFFGQQDDARSLITPQASDRPSLSAFLSNGMDTSARSLVSRNSGVLHEDFVKPNYDDDIISAMGASTSSSFLSPGKSEDGSVQGPNTDGSMYGSSPTPGSTPRYGSRRQSSPNKNNRMKLPIALPDLGIDDDKD